MPVRSKRPKAEMRQQATDFTWQALAAMWIELQRTPGLRASSTSNSSATRSIEAAAYADSCRPHGQSTFPNNALKCRGILSPRTLNVSFKLSGSGGTTWCAWCWALQPCSAFCGSVFGPLKLWACLRLRKFAQVCSVEILSSLQLI